jgi:tRNA pseudouridine38-40 synthase
MSDAFVVVRATVAYDGTDFAGFQRQPDARTVQQDLETALAELYGRKVTVHGAGRTDAGVHARGQVIAFYVPDCVPPERVAVATNSRLPRDVALRASELAPAGFDPRRHATARVYRYTLALDRLHDPLRDRYSTRVEPGLDVDAMMAASPLLVGSHEFASFTVRDDDEPLTRRTLDRLDWSRCDERVTLELEAESFLRKQVRCIMGSLLALARGKIGPETIQAMLAGGPRPPVVAVAPPQGLVLERVDYGAAPRRGRREDRSELRERTD